VIFLLAHLQNVFTAGLAAQFFFGKF